MQNSKQKKQSRYRADPDKGKVLQVQDRDLVVIKQVMEDRFLTIQQIQALFFPSYDMARKRMQKLWNAGLLKREIIPASVGSNPSFYGLTAKGKNLLLESGTVKPEQMRWHKDSNRSGFQFKQHEVDINDVKVALTVASRTADTKLYLFGKESKYFDRVDNPEPESHEKNYIPIRPDGFIILQHNSGYEYLFLEVDRGTMALKRLRSKLKGYRRYYFEGGFFAKYGQEGYRKEDYSFRVLITCRTEEMCNTRLEQACCLGSNMMCLFAVHKDVVQNPFGKVWVRGKEYKEALQKLPIEIENQWMYSRDKSDRDQFIRDNVSKISILD